MDRETDSRYLAIIFPLHAFNEEKTQSAGNNAMQQSIITSKILVILRGK
jgi:hypothetical protein